jgi:hypothetical protein
MAVPITVMQFLDATYPEPQPLASAEAFARMHHDDLADLSLDEIDAERILARQRWAVFIHHRAEPTVWLEERIARLDLTAARLRKGAPQR